MIMGRFHCRIVVLEHIHVTQNQFSVLGVNSETTLRGRPRGHDVSEKYDDTEKQLDSAKYNEDEDDEED